MQIVLRYTDEKSDKFWRAETFETDLLTNYGKWGSTGKFDMKHFETPEQCRKQAEKLIASKQKKGYTETSGFDAAAQKYFDVPGSSPHRLTSHPIYRAYFQADLYYDCGAEFSPFGNDTGNDVLWMLNDLFRKYPNYTAEYFLSSLEKSWGFPIILPGENPEDFDLHGMPVQEVIRLSNQAILAMVFGMLNISGKVRKSQADLALHSLDRMEEEEEKSESIQRYAETLRHDLQAYIRDTYHGSYYGYVGEANMPYLQKALQEGFDGLHIAPVCQGRELAEILYQKTDELLLTGNWPESFGNIYSTIFHMGVLFGHSLCTGYGWQWKQLGDDSLMAEPAGVISPGERYSVIPRQVFERILKDKAENTILLLYNMLENIDAQQIADAQEFFYPLG